MYTWLFFIIIVSQCFAVLIFHNRNNKKLPPGPSFLSSNFILLTTSLKNLYPIIKNFESKYGPLITFSPVSGPYIFVNTLDLAHEILIHKGSVFSDRPKSLVMRTISSSSYDPTWKVLRTNLASEILHPSRVKSYSWARKWALHILISRLQDHKEDASGIKVVDHFEHAIFSLLVLICFGEKFEEHRINEIIVTLRHVLFVTQHGSLTVYIFSLFPKESNPLIKSRIEAVNSEPQGNQIVAYVDTLVNLQLPKEEDNKGNGGKLTHRELMNMCSEFLNGGTHSTFTALKWIMANLVKYPDIQSKLYDEIIAVVGPPPREVESEFVISEEDL
ncbi:hypothetical protein LXL04_011057 [Taraxacum kok-saghyz]